MPALGRQRQVDFWVRGQPGLQSEFQDSQSYTEKPCLKKRQDKKEKKEKKDTEDIQKNKKTYYENLYATTLEILKEMNNFPDRYQS
jgi:flagellar biosynthesis/type III secretory pathway protein FliH